MTWTRLGFDSQGRKVAGLSKRFSPKHTSVSCRNAPYKSSWQSKMQVLTRHWPRNDKYGLGAMHSVGSGHLLPAAPAQKVASRQDGEDGPHRKVGTHNTGAVQGVKSHLH